MMPELMMAWLELESWKLFLIFRRMSLSMRKSVKRVMKWMIGRSCRLLQQLNLLLSIQNGMMALILVFIKNLRLEKK